MFQFLRSSIFPYKKNASELRQDLNVLILKTLEGVLPTFFMGGWAGERGYRPDWYDIRNYSLVLRLRRNDVRNDLKVKTKFILTNERIQLQLPTGLNITQREADNR